MRRSFSLILVALLIASLFPILSYATLAQPTGVQTVILRPTGDDLRDWDIPAMSGWVNITPAGDEYFQGATWEDEGRGGLAYLASGDAYQAAWRIPTTSIPVGSVLEEVHLVIYKYDAGGGTQDYDQAFYTILEGTATFASIGDSTNTNKHFDQGTFLGYYAETAGAHQSNFSLSVAALESQRTSYSNFYVACTNTTQGGSWTGYASLEHATTTWRPYVWVKYAGGDHHEQLDETTSGGDGLTTYVATNTAPEYDRFSMSDVPVGCSGLVKSITSVQVWSLEARADGSGNSNIRFGVYIGTTYYEGDTYSPTTSFVNRTYTWTTNPDTSAAWTLSEVQSLVIYLHTTDADPQPRVTQLAVLVTVNYGWAATFTSTPPTAPHLGYWWPNDAYSYTVTLNESATIANDLKPAFLTWTAGNSTLWGRLALTITTQTASVVFHATSTNGKQCSWQNYSFNIVNTAPTFSSSPVTTINAITNYYYDANAADPEAITLYYDLEGNYTSATINHDTGVVERAQPQTVGWYWINITAFDGLYTTYQSFQMTVTYVTSFFTSSPILTIHWNTTYHYVALVTSSYDIVFGIETNWTGATISNDTVAGPDLTGEVNNSAPHIVGWYYVHVNVSDGYDVYWQNYSVNVTNTIPAFTSTPDYVVVELFDYSYDVDATQVPADGDSLTYGLETNWSGATINPSTGVISKTQPHVIGWYYLHANVTDDYIIVWQNFTVNVSAAWAPTFTSSPVTTVYSHAAYVYHITWNETVSDITFSTNASWLSWIDSIVRTVTGTSPTTNVTLQFYVNVTAKSVNGGLVAYSNWTIVVLGTVAPSGVAIGPIESTTLSLILGFGLIGMALVMRDKRFWLIALSGITWILAGVLVYPDYDAGWVILTIGFGIALLYEGTTGLMELKK